MKTTLIVLLVIYAVVGVLAFGAMAIVSTAEGAPPDWKGAVIAGLTWPYVIARIALIHPQ